MATQPLILDAARGILKRGANLLQFRRAGGGQLAITDDYAAANSYQTVAADLDLDAAAGTSDAGDSAFLAPAMFNLLGATLTKTHNYLAGIIGAFSVTGSKAGELQAGAVLGVVMDGVSDADGAVVAVIDGSDPSSATRVNAMFAARMNNNHASSGADYGLDLYDAGRSSGILSGGGHALAYAKADIRMAGEVCILHGAGVPTSGSSGTGKNVAGIGSLYIDVTNGNAYIQVAAYSSPSWKLVTRAA